ncbi:MAG TPA: Gfo/Idh/MocA family oxidoreductase [Opitutaceae bacterium]
MSQNYDLTAAALATTAAPELAYAPPMPRQLRPRIGLIGCGGITEHHLRAYRNAGWDVVAFYDPLREAAEKRRREFYPEARVCTGVEELLATPGLDVVDIATHVAVRGPLIEQAIAAGKHVLSQKPFVLDLAEGRRLVALAAAAGVKLAVNQNGRWAPAFAYFRQAVRAGLIGKISSVAITLNWDHTWTAGTAFEKMHHLVLYDFAIHWFDAAYSFFGGEAARSVFATLATAPEQPIKPPLVASSVVTFPSGLATLAFNGCSRHAPTESCTIVGSLGTLQARGGVCALPAVELTTAAGQSRSELRGAWFPDGFQGTMGELLCAIEEDRPPENSAEDNLKSLAICLGALRSADEGAVVAL